MNLSESLTHINYWAVLVAAFASMALGAIWYSPLLFVKAWMAENKITRDPENGKSSALPMIISFILNIIMAFNLALFLAGPPDFLSGLIAGGLAGIGWVALSVAVLYLFEGKSLKLFLINGGYLALSFIIMGGILGVWK